VNKLAVLHDVAFVGAEKFSEIYIQSITNFIVNQPVNTYQFYKCIMHNIIAMATKGKAQKGSRIPLTRDIIGLLGLLYIIV